jgi:glutathione S-transferase
MIEIHGMRMCPFAWRARVCAREKGVAFEWMPFDAPSPDPRALRHNPERKSPKLVEGDFELIESQVILQYLDEACAGPALQPPGARERALLRLRLQKLEALEQHVSKDAPPDLEKLRKGFDALEEALADGRPWLGGGSPDLSDVAVWPFLWMLEEAGVEARPAEYWRRAKARESLAQTRPR